MKQANRFTCILLTLILYVSAAMPVSASFPDVDKNAGYAEAVEYLADIGIFSGDENGNFNPDKTVTRAEMAVIVCKMLGETEDLSKADTFTDVPQEHWANAYIARAAELGIISGYGDGTFGPGDAVTYEQAVTMVVRALGLEDEANEYGGYHQKITVNICSNPCPSNRSSVFCRFALIPVGHTFQNPCKTLDITNRGKPS